MEKMISINKSNVTDQYIILKEEKMKPKKPEKFLA
jgi:hypothetical protein